MEKGIIIFAFILTLFGCKKTSKPELLESPNDTTVHNPPPTVQDDRIDFTNCDTTIVFGDSWSDYTFNQNNYVKIFSDSSKQVIINTAAIGLGSGNMVFQAYDKMSTVKNVNILALCGFNDVRFRGLSPELINFQKNAYRALLVNQFLKTWRPAGDMDRRGGNFTSFYQPLDNHFKSYYSTGKKAVYTSSTTNVFLEYDFTGTNIGVSFVGQDTTAIAFYEDPIGRWRVLIDGVVVDTPNVYQQTYGNIPGYMAPQTVFPFIKLYAGLSNGSHVLRLEPIDDGNKFVDFIFTLKEPSLVNPVAILKVPYMTSAGYLIDPLFNKANDLAMDKVNFAISDVRNEFIRIDTAYAKKIKLINTPDYFDRTLNYLPDLIHPNDNGHLNLFSALKKNIIY